MESDADALEAQQELLEICLPAVFTAFDEAVERDVERPVVILLDCEDAIGGQIARGWLGDDAVDEAIAEVGTTDLDEEAITVFAFGFSWEECQREIPQVFPYLASVFDEVAVTEGFLAISVTSGGASALTVPMDARPAPSA